jgi:putative aminopeptidase FrvX
MTVIALQRRTMIALALCQASATALPAQLPTLDALSVRLTGMTAVSGYEQAMVDSLRTMLNGAVVDRVGNVVLTLGEGAPRRLLACPIDEPGFVVGGIRADGYLTLRRAGRSPGPLADQQYEGQRVTVFGRGGAVPGVVGVHSIHLSRGRTVGDAPFTFDSAFVDVGAESAAEVSRLGIGMLAPVARAKEPLRYGDSLLAGPGAGRRTACAALLRAAAATHAVEGSVVVAFVVEQNFTRRGLRFLLSTGGPYRAVALVDGVPDESTRAVPPQRADAGVSDTFGLRARYDGTPVETVSLPEAARLEERLKAWIAGGTP